MSGTNLSTTLGGYVTASSLTTTLGSYVTSSALTTTLGGYMPKSGGTFTGNITLGTNSIVFINPSAVSRTLSSTILEACTMDATLGSLQQGSLPLICREVQVWLLSLSIQVELSFWIVPQLILVGYSSGPNMLPQPISQIAALCLQVEQPIMVVLSHWQPQVLTVRVHCLVKTAQVYLIWMWRVK